MIKIDTSDKVKWKKIEDKMVNIYNDLFYFRLIKALEVLNEQGTLTPHLDEYQSILEAIKNYKKSYPNEEINKIIKEISKFNKSNIFKKDKNKPTQLEIDIKNLELNNLDTENFNTLIDELKTLKLPINKKLIELKFMNFRNVDTNLFFKIYKNNESARTPLDKRKLQKALSSSNNSFLHINYIFDYDLFSKDYRHSIISSMNITVCPYCQRNYISNYIDKDKTNDIDRTTADLDHFYPQSKHPYLALSLYNFIPSCQICNSRMKGAKDTSNAIYPYSESYDDYGAKFTTNNLVGLLDDNLEKNPPFKVSIKKNSKDIKKNSKVDRSNEIFKINEVYKTNHNEYILDMLTTIRNRPKTYTTKLEEDLFGNSKAYKEELKNKSIEDRFQELVKAPYKFKIDKGEPLVKLTKDILEEFGIKV